MALGRRPIEIVNEGKHQLLAKAEHWERIYLKEVAKVQNGYAFSSSNFVKSGGLPLIRIRDINSVSTVDRFEGEYSDEFIVKKGDVLIGMDGDFKAAIWKGENALLNQRVCRIIPNAKNYDPKFLFICLQPYLNAINEETSSVTVKHLSSRTIEEIPLPFPPRPEQKAIVSKIEELFSSLDKGIESLKTAQQQLKVYRQAVLKWAFEGKLTNKFDSWRQTTLGKVISISSGNGLTRDRRNENGKYIVYGGNGIAGKHDEYLFNKSKLIIGRVGAHCGNAHITKPYSWVTDNAFVVTFNEEEFEITYLYHLIISLNLNKYSSSTAQPVISQGKIYPIELAVPKTITEQRAIVAEIESRLSVCDKIEESIEQSLRQSESLRQSILKKAFEGKLVPQDPNDEPASKLLERIKAEKEKTAIKKRSQN